MTKFRRLTAFILEILENMCLVIICYPACEVINFEIKLSFLIKLFSYTAKKQDKSLNTLKTKTAFNIK